LARQSLKFYLKKKHSIVIKLFYKIILSAIKKKMFHLLPAYSSKFYKIGNETNGYF